MNTIWKFELRYIDGPQRIEMPTHATIIHAHNQVAFGMLDCICVWAIVRDNLAKTGRVLYVVETGHIMPENVTLRYVGTVHRRLPPFVWHVFEETQ